MKKDFSISVIHAVLSIFLLTFLVIFPSPSHGQSAQQSEETLAITTYYPSPYGVYKELRSQRMAIGDAYYDGGLHPWDTDGNLLPDEISQGADLVVEGNVGIGTSNPIGAQLHVAAPTTQGAILISGGSDNGNTYSALYLDDDDLLDKISWVFAYKNGQGTVY